MTEYVTVTSDAPEGRTGAIKLNFPDLEVWEMTETCALDVADRGGITLEEVGAIMNLTRERIRQVETRGLLKLRAMAEDEPRSRLGPPPEVEEAPGQFWKDFIAATAPEFRKPTIEQLTTFKYQVRGSGQTRP